MTPELRAQLEEIARRRAIDRRYSIRLTSLGHTGEYMQQDDTVTLEEAAALLASLLIGTLEEMEEERAKACASLPEMLR